MSLSFKKFMTFVNLEGDVSDEQINEIFGIFKNNAKLDKLKKEREKLKGMSADKKREIDQALKDFAAGRKTPVTDHVKGALKDVDWDDVLSSDDRKFNAKQDRARNAKPAFESVANLKLDEAVKVKAFKIEIPQGLTDSAIWDFINDQSIVTIEDFERKGNTVYLYPHFDHDYDPHMTGAMQSAFNRYLKDEGLNESKDGVMSLDSIRKGLKPIIKRVQGVESQEDYDALLRSFGDHADVVDQHVAHNGSIDSVADRLHYHQRQPNVAAFLKKHVVK